MTKYLAILTLALAFTLPARAGELDRESPAQAAPPAIGKVTAATSPSATQAGSELDVEAFQQDCFFWRPWGYGFGPAWGWGYRPYWGYNYAYSYGYAPFGFGYAPYYSYAYRYGYCW